MELSVLGLIFGFSILMVIMGGAVLKEKGFSRFYVLAGYTIMMILGIVLLGGSSIAFQTGNNNITQSGDETFVSPETTTYGWADTVIGSVILLLGVGGSIVVIGNMIDKQDPYKGGSDYPE